MTNNKFGGSWTVEKLNIIGKYIDAYSKALKNFNFRKIYIDAFAGTGSVDIKLDGNEITIDGSARIALSGTCPFDEYIFVEQNKNYADQLGLLKNEYPDRNINIFTGDCNQLISSYCTNSDIKYSRILVFLDPFSTEVAWSTIKQIAKTDVIDIWYLVPLSAICRMLPKNGVITSSCESKLIHLFGDDSWKSLYHKPRQIGLFESDEDIERDADYSQIIDYVYKKLDSIFEKVIKEPAILKNSKKSPLFAFFFAMTNQSPKAQKLAIRLAEDILKAGQSQ
jgi:three-Cys-motif partner protein